MAIEVRAAGPSPEDVQKVLQHAADAQPNLEEKLAAVVIRLRKYAESYDLLEQESLLHAIVEKIQKHNTANPNKQITVLEIYTWILGDKVKAREMIWTAEQSKKFREKEGQQGKEGFVYKETKDESEIPTNIQNIEQLSATLIDILRTKNIPGINIFGLEKFLDQIGKSTSKSDAKEALQKIILQRTKEIEQNPKRGVIILKVLVSSIKAVYNRTMELQTHQFNEQEVKASLLTISQHEKSPEGRAIMSTVHGRINEVAIILAQSGVLGKQNRPIAGDYYYVLAQMMQAKKTEKDFTIVCVHVNEDEKENFLRFLEEQLVKFPPPKVEFIQAGEIDLRERYDFWARDGAVRRNDGTIVEPREFYEAEDIERKANSALGNAATYDNLVPIKGTDLEQSDLYFQGGNIRSTNTNLFIGIDDIQKTAKSFYKISENDKLTKEQIDAIIQKFEQEFGKKVVVIGSTENGQPVFHIDMGVTPLDNKTLLIAKPVLGQDDFQETRDELVKQGFTVATIPYYASYLYNKKPIIISYNNALIERYHDSNGKEIKKVYLPQYYSGTPQEPVYSFSAGTMQIDLQRLNREATEIYQSQGFEVVPIQMSTSIIQGKGALNCLSFENREK